LPSGGFLYVSCAPNGARFKENPAKRDGIGRHLGRPRLRRDISWTGSLAAAEETSRRLLCPRRRKGQASPSSTGGCQTFIGLIKRRTVITWAGDGEEAFGGGDPLWGSLPVCGLGLIGEPDGFYLPLPFLWSGTSLAKVFCSVCGHPYLPSGDWNKRRGVAEKSSSPFSTGKVFPRDGGFVGALLSSSPGRHCLFCSPEGEGVFPVNYDILTRR